MSEMFDEIRRRARRYAEAMWGPAWDADLAPAEASMRLAQAGRAMNEADDEQAVVRRKVEAWIRHGEAVPPGVTTYDREIVHAELRNIFALESDS